MKVSNRLRIEIVWGRTEETLREQVKVFWKRENAIINPVTLDERAYQLVAVIRNNENDIVGVSTAAKVQVRLLNNNWLYQYRCFISPRARVISLDVHITVESIKFLEANESKEEKFKAIGVFVVVESPNLIGNPISDAAVWRGYKMYFIGFNTQGRPIRVYYFKNAKI